MTREKEAPAFPVGVTAHAVALGCDRHLCYLVSGEEKSALVEGGVSALTPLVLNQLGGLAGAAPLSLLVMTHTHADHSTGLLRLKKENPALLLCATAESGRVLQNEKILARLLDEDLLYSELLVARGTVAENPGRPDPGTVCPDREIEDGDVLDLGGTTVAILETPGHAPGALSAWVLPDRLLLVSDAAGFSADGERIYPMFFQDLGLYLSSLSRLAALAPECVGLGHHLIIRGKGACADFFRRARGEALSMAEDMKSREEKGEERDAVARDWAERLRGFPFFAEFPLPSLMSYARLLCRRACEAEI